MSGLSGLADDSGLIPRAARNAEDAILQELFCGIPTKILSGKNGRGTKKKHGKQGNDQKRHKPCKSLWLVGLEMPSGPVKIGQI